MLACEREVLHLELADEHIVDDLRHGRARHPGPVAQAFHLHDLPRGVVGHAPVGDLSRPQEVVHRADRLVDRRLQIRLVQVVEVDLLDAEPLQTLVAGVPHAPGGEPFRGSLADPGADLGGDAGILAPSAQGASKDPLRLAVVVGVRSVEDGNAAGERPVDDPAGLLLGGPLAEVHGSDDDRRLRRRPGAQPGFHPGVLTTSRVTAN